MKWNKVVQMLLIMFVLFAGTFVPASAQEPAPTPEPVLAVDSAATQQQDPNLIISACLVGSAGETCGAADRFLPSLGTVYLEEEFFGWQAFEMPVEVLVPYGAQFDVSTQAVEFEKFVCPRKTYKMIESGKGEIKIPCHERGPLGQFHYWLSTVLNIH